MCKEVTVINRMKVADNKIICMWKIIMENTNKTEKSSHHNIT